MSDLEIRVQALATQMGTDIGTVIAKRGLLANLDSDTQVSIVSAINEGIAKRGDLSLLTTTVTTSIVAAINSLQTGVDNAGDMYKSDNLTGLADTAVARTNIDVRSTQEVTDEIQAAITTVVGGAPEALNTLTELISEISGNDTDIMTLMTAVGNKVSFAAVQTLTAAQKLQACQNIGIGDPDHDYLIDYTTARDAAAA